MKMMTPIVYNEIEMLRHDEERGCFEFFATIDDNFMRLPKGRNPRSTDKSGKTYKNIKQTLEKIPASFENLNRGIIGTVSDVVVDRTNNRLTAYCDPANQDGNFDGGHTQDAIDEMKSLVEPGVGRVRVRLHTGDLSDEEIKAMAYANNDMKGHEARNHEDLGGSFDNLKTALGPTICKNVSFYDGDPGTYRVEDLIDMEIMITAPFAAKFFPAGRLAKVSSAASFYRKGTTAKVEWHGKRLESLARLSTGPKPLIREVAKLWDYVSERTEFLYDAATKKSSYKKLGFHEKPVSSRRPLAETLSGTPVPFAMPRVFRMMIMEGLLRQELMYDRAADNLTWRDSLVAAQERYTREAYAVVRKLATRWANHDNGGGTGRDFSEDMEVWNEVAQLLS